MTGSSSEELVYAPTEDGFLLAGVTIQPSGGSSAAPTIVWIHGNASTFYDHSTIMIGRELARHGYAFVSGNTRGQAIAAFLARVEGGMPVGGGGAAWEILEEAPRDVAAWVTLAHPLGTGGVILVGHSVGAGKAIQYQADRQDPRVTGIVLAAPATQIFSPPGTLEAARHLVAEGRGLEVLPAQPYAPWYRQSAQNAVSAAAVWAGLFTSPEGESAIAHVHVPLLVIRGSQDPASPAGLDLTGQNALSARLDTQIIANADHFFSGQAAEVAQVIATWMAALQGDLIGPAPLSWVRGVGG